jgi:hypothetical protein
LEQEVDVAGNLSASLWRILVCTQKKFKPACGRQAIPVGNSEWRRAELDAALNKNRDSADTHH